MFRININSNWDPRTVLPKPAAVHCSIKNNIRRPSRIEVATYVRSARSPHRSRQSQEGCIRAPLRCYLLPYYSSLDLAVIIFRTERVLLQSSEISISAHKATPTESMDNGNNSHAAFIRIREQRDGFFVSTREAAKGSAYPLPLYLLAVDV